MRLLLLPLSTRASASSSAPSKRTLLYAQRLTQAPPGQASYADRITTRAATQWRKWEKYEKGWQNAVTRWGNRALSRIPYQEWGLKSVPSIQARRRALEGQAQVEREERTGKDGAPGDTSAEGKMAERRVTSGEEDVVDVVFPAQYLSQTEAEAALRQLATTRQGLHRRGLWWSIAAMPVTAPFALIPVIPNIPFFYVAFRAWSHWKALAGARHLAALLTSHSLHYRSSDLLQRVYDLRIASKVQVAQLEQLSADEAEADAAVRDAKVLDALDAMARASQPPAMERRGPPNNVQHAVGTQAKEVLLLQHDSATLLATAAGVPGLDVEIERAVAQVGRLIEKEEREEREKDGVKAEAKEEMKEIEVLEQRGKEKGG